MAHKKKNYYFTQEHEDAIVGYCCTEDPKTRNDLYKEFRGREADPQAMLRRDGLAKQSPKP